MLDKRHRISVIQHRFASTVVVSYRGVFGGAFAAGWAVANLAGLEGTAVHVLQGVFFLCGVAVMVRFVLNARRVEPFSG